VSLALPI